MLKPNPHDALHTLGNLPVSVRQNSLLVARLETFRLRATGTSVAHQQKGNDRSHKSGHIFPSTVGPFAETLWREVMMHVTELKDTAFSKPPWYF